MTDTDLEILRVLALMVSFWVLIIGTIALRRYDAFRRFHDSRAGKALEICLALGWTALVLYVLPHGYLTDATRRAARHWRSLLPLLPGLAFWVTIGVLYVRRCVPRPSPGETDAGAHPSGQEVTGALR